MALIDELEEVIASFVTNRGETEVVRISHSNIDTLYISEKVKDGQTIIDENSLTQTVNYVPMKLSDESSGKLLLNERQLTMQGINDLIAAEEDKIPTDSSEKVKIDVLTYLHDYDGNLSEVARGPYRYFNRKSTYSSQSNSATLTISTTPTNNYTTGDIFDENTYPTMRGFK